MLVFSDGMTFDTSGDPRIVWEKDGLYVCGKGMLIPVGSYEEALLVIEKLEFVYE